MNLPKAQHKYLWGDPSPLMQRFEPPPAYKYWRDHITGEIESVPLFGGDAMRADDV